jgi:hypothetical protein
MSDRSAIYAASPDNAIEVQRALRICLCGMRAPAVLSFGGGDFAAWARQSFLQVIAPHALAVHEMAQRGDADGTTAADATLELPPASVQAGRELLEQREGARYMPVVRRFSGAVADGRARGHFATVLTLYAADFSIALLPLLQCLLYCEWRAGQPVDSQTGLDRFFRDAAGILASLPGLLPTETFPGFQALPAPRGENRKKGRN